MKSKNEKRKSELRKELPEKAGGNRWLLRLYVAGQTHKSTTALHNLKIICEEYLKGKYRIDVIDLLKHPHQARVNQIFAVPTLVRKVPQPVRNIIGDLSNKETVLNGLDLKTNFQNTTAQKKTNTTVTNE